MHVPGWHEATRKLQSDGKLLMVGIIQEQHPDRARLFMQWKKMGWPILVDSLNLLETPLVPVTVAIDEHGIVRHVGLPVRAARTIEETFLDKEFPTSARATSRRLAANEWTSQADSIVLWGREAEVTQAIGAYQKALAENPGDGWTHFRLGVAYRKRYDSSHSVKGDFAKAIEHWNAALDIDPNQYIWRRRIQQYGPRLDKPYPFYDWVNVARKEVAARGETPSPLVVEPGGAEFTRPARSFSTSSVVKEEPDPRGRILRDENEFIRAETVVVPDTSSKGISARVHVFFRPITEKKAHWNNEVDGLVFWLNPPDGWQVDTRFVELANPQEIVSQETRKVEFEIRGPAGSKAGGIIPGYALYYVCEDVNGVCMYRRQDVSVQVPAAKP